MNAGATIEPRTRPSADPLVDPVEPPSARPSLRSTPPATAAPATPAIARTWRRETVHRPSDGRTPRSGPFSGSWESDGGWAPATGFSRIALQI